jgi:hypothetical protein
MNRIKDESADLTCAPETSASSSATYDKRPTLTAAVNYLDSSRKSVRANLAREEDNDTPFEPHEVVIHNARLQPTALDREGFALFRFPSKIADTGELLEANRTFSIEDPAISIAFKEEQQPLIEKLSGAREVMPFIAGVVIRHSDRHKESTWQKAVAMVHIDITAETLDNFIKYSYMKAGRELKPYRHAATFQIWRPITPPPQDSMVTWADGRTVSHSDVVPMEVVFSEEGDLPHERFMSRGIKYNPNHRWHYFPDMQEGEVIVFKGYDSRYPDSTNVAHTAFDNPDGGIPRSSVEARYIALFD